MSAFLIACHSDGKVRVEVRNISTDTIRRDDSTAKEVGVLVGGAVMYPGKAILENLSTSLNHKILTQLLKGADLLDTVSDKSLVTVFAPTDSAFNALPHNSLNMLNDKNNNLKRVLAYHVVEGHYELSDLKDGMVLKSIEGEQLKVSIKNNKIYINNASIDVQDVISSNGVIHVINSVLMPPKNSKS
ncbi:fasciclin domain-containing protein [Pelobium sp.]|nr:fasciclin domain-containing protein [Pelobium sp.]MDA9554836.1 fasciclin domain-containing protein [Pelobium sp.]